jgi:hypothetical protein
MQVRVNGAKGENVEWKSARCAPLVIGAVVMSTGCYSYRPTQVETIPVGQEVRVTLTRQGRFELPEQFDQEGAYISGQVTRRDAERLYLNVPIARREQGFFVSQITQEVGVRNGEVVDVQLRKLNGPKTGLFVIGTAAAAAAVVYAIIEASSRSTDDRLPGQEEFRIPILSIPVR